MKVSLSKLRYNIGTYENHVSEEVDLKDNSGSKYDLNTYRSAQGNTNFINSYS